MEQLLEAANWAPTHGRTEPWKFVVLGRAKQEELLDLTLKVGNKYARCMRYYSESIHFSNLKDVLSLDGSSTTIHRTGAKYTGW